MTPKASELRKTDTLYFAEILNLYVKNMHDTSPLSDTHIKYFLTFITCFSYSQLFTL